MSIAPRAPRYETLPTEDGCPPIPYPGAILYIRDVEEEADRAANDAAMAAFGLEAA